MGSASQITHLLGAWRDGDRAAFDAVFPLVYTQLKQSAAAQLRRVGGAQTIGQTALVNEAYLKLASQGKIEWQDRGHFMAVAATAMRHILVNYAKSRQANKRGGDWLRVTYDESSARQDTKCDKLLALNDALEQLAREHKRLAKVVELRFFGGFTEAEISDSLDINERTARRDWHKAKTLLSLNMAGDSTTIEGAAAQ